MEEERNTELFEEDTTESDTPEERDFWLEEDKVPPSATADEDETKMSDDGPEGESYESFFGETKETPDEDFFTDSEEDTGDEEANPPDASAEPEEPDDDQKSADAEPKADQFTLKHLDEVKVVGRDEVVSLAQKGMDYDRIRGKLNEAVSSSF